MSEDFTDDPLAPPLYDAGGRVELEPPDVVLHGKRSELGHVSIVGVSIGGRRIDVLGFSTLSIQCGPGPANLTATLVVGQITIEYE